MSKKARILYLCGESDTLALMAEGFTRYYGGTTIEVQSVARGSQEAHPYCNWAMNETGIDIGDIKPLKSPPADMARFTHVVRLHPTGDEVTADLPAGVRSETWVLPDPVKARGRPKEVILAFRSVRNQIEKKVKALLAAIFE